MWTCLTGRFLVDELPSWSIGLSAREGRRFKLHVIDTGLAAATMSADARALCAPARQ
jgi:uncharacterized protein